MKQLRAALTMLLLFTALLGLAYPLAMTGLGQFVFQHQADGSLIQRNGAIAGSGPIGQSFTQPVYFWPRPSAAGKSYDAAASGATNLAPSSAILVTQVRNRALEAVEKGHGRAIPIDYVTASGSGLDPHISPESAAMQVARVAKARQIAEDDVRKLVETHTEPPTFGILGQPRVNVLALNLALDMMGRETAQ